MADFTERNKSTFDSFVVRPGAVLAKDTGMPGWAVGLTMSVKVDHLAATMIDVALNGSEIKTIENAALGSRGKTLLEGAT